MNEDQFNFSGHDWRDLSPLQRAEARHEIICRAHAMRSQAMQAVIAFLIASTTRMSRLIRDSYARWVTTRREREAISRLQSLDDHALGDIRIRRSEIESIVRADGCDKTRRVRCGGNRARAA